MLNSFQLGGSSWTPSTPLTTSKRAPSTSGGYMGHGGHFVFQDSSPFDAGSVAADDSPVHQTYRPSATTPHTQFLNSSTVTDREESPNRSNSGSVLKSKYTKPESSLDRGRSVVDGTGLNLVPLAGQLGDRRQVKGYYDGLLDIPYEQSPVSKTRATERNSTTVVRVTKNETIYDSPAGGSPFPSYTPGITQPSARSGKKPIYSWQLDDFGRSDEIKG